MQIASTLSSILGLDLWFTGPQSESESDTLEKIICSSQSLLLTVRAEAGYTSLHPSPPSPQKTKQKNKLKNIENK